MSNGRSLGIRHDLHGAVPVGVRADSTVAGGEIPSLTERLWNSDEVMSLNAELGLTMDQLVRLARVILNA